MMLFQKISKKIEYLIPYESFSEYADRHPESLLKILQVILENDNIILLDVFLKNIQSTKIISIDKTHLKQIFHDLNNNPNKKITFFSRKQI